MDYSELIEAIRNIHQESKERAVHAVNTSLTLQNWLVGYYIVEYEQRGSDRAQYGEELLPSLSSDLTERLGKGFSGRNLRLFRQFYRTYPIWQTASAKLPSKSVEALTTLLSSADLEPDTGRFSTLVRQVSWSHFVELIRIEDPLKRSFYEIETLKNNWSVRELKRQIDSLLFERIGLSREKEEVLELAKRGELITTPEEMVRDPYVFEFLGLSSLRIETLGYELIYQSQVNLK